MTHGAPLTDVRHWEAFWSREAPADVIPDKTFDPVLWRLLPRGHLDAVEIGCFPGTYMAYLGQRFGYRVSGIDFLPDLERIRAPLERAGVEVDTLFGADFLSFESDRRWDVVASFGFIEHFEDVEGVLDAHLRLLRPGGHLVIQVPHFGGLHRLLRRALEPELLASHNLEAMRPRSYARWLEDRGLEILYCDYFRTFDFWLSSSAPILEERFAPRHRAIMWATVAARALLRSTRLEHVPNRWLSPFVLVVARAPGARR